MPRKIRSKSVDANPPVVNFQFQDRTYQIDPERQKVYRRFVEIETAKAFEIYSIWRSQNASV